MATGTKEGRIFIHRIGLSNQLILQTKAGSVFGGISALDVQGNGEYMVAGSETGEIVQYELLKKLNEERAE